MKNVKNWILAVLMMTLASLTACKKNENVDSSDVRLVDELSVKNGMLVFRDTTVFRRYFEKLLKNEKLILPTMNFVSYQTAFENMQKEFSDVASEAELKSFLLKFQEKVVFNSDSSISPIFINPLVHSIINTEGQFMIGNKLQLFTKSAYIEIEDPNPSKINNAISNRSTSSKVQVGIPTVKAIQATGRINQTIHYNNDNNRRLFIQTFNEAVPGSSTEEKRLYIKLYQERKGTFGSWSGNTTDIYINNLVYNGNVETGFPFTTFVSYVSYPNNTYAYQSASWSNVSTIYYDLALYNGFSTPFYYFRNLHSITLSGSFVSGGVPSAPTTSFTVQ